VATGLALAGRTLRAVLVTAGDGAPFRLVIYSLAGWVELHLALTALQAAGVAWTLPAVAGAILAAMLAARAATAALARRRLLPGRPLLGSRSGWRPGWGDGLALAALAAFTACALSGWIANPDFIYHWGLKGERFLLAGGVDYRYLAAPWNWVVHPDYPNLLPELFTVTALAAGRFDEPAMMLWSTVCFGLLLAAASEALRRAGASRFVAQATLAGLAMALAAYGIGGQTAGGADWLIALALSAALPPLLAPANPRGAAQIGVIAAFAAAAKVEGVPLAVVLIALYAVRLVRAGARGMATRGEAARGLAAGTPAAPDPDTRSLSARHRLAPALSAAAALALPAAAVTLPWLAAVRHHHLFQEYNSGPLAPARLGPVVAAMARSLRGAWWGFGYGLVLLPLLALDRRLRTLAAAISLQLLFYVYVYLSVRIDAVALVGASFPRLVLQLLPALLTGAAIALERPARPAIPPARPAAPAHLPLPSRPVLKAPASGAGNA
jgi:hypothetical protein